MKHAALRSLLFAFCVVAAACGGGSKQAEATTPATATVQADVVLELGELTLFEGDEAIAKIHADGKTEFGEGGTWKSGPTLKQDGTVEVEGTAVAKVNADGTIIDVKSNAKLPLVVTADKVTMSSGDQSMSIELGATGAITVVGDNASQPKKPIRVDGAKTPGQRRTALAFLAIMVGAAAAGPPPSEEGTAPPATPPG